MSSNSSDNLRDASAAPGVSEQARQQYLEQPLEQLSSQPVRRLDWRYAWVQSLMARQATSRAAPVVPEDQYILAMRQFLRRYAPSPPAARQRLAVQFPGPYGAIQLREESSPELQLSVQCRILTAQTETEIACRTGLPPLAVHWYEKFFYDVRENLHTPDWVSACALNADSLENLSPLEGALKVAAYFGGVMLFESLQSGFAKPQSLESPVDLDDLDDNLDKVVVAGIRRRAVLKVLDPAPLSPKDQAFLVRQMRSLAAYRSKLEGNVGEREQMMAACLQHTLGQIHFIKGDMAIDWLKKHNPNVLEYDSFAAELRDQQVYMAASGNLAPLEHMRHRKFPPPPKRDATPQRPADFDPLAGS